MPKSRPLGSQCPWRGARSPRSRGRHPQCVGPPISLPKRSLMSPARLGGGRTARRPAAVHLVLRPFPPRSPQPPRRRRVVQQGHPRARMAAPGRGLFTLRPPLFLLSYSLSSVVPRTKGWGSSRSWLEPKWLRSLSLSRSRSLSLSLSLSFFLGGVGATLSLSLSLSLALSAHLHLPCLLDCIHPAGNSWRQCNAVLNSNICQVHHATLID